jgi:WD40 repeat protein
LAFVSGGQDATLRMWDTASGAQRCAFDWQIGKVYTVAIAPDGMRAAAGGERDIVIWDVDEG